MKPKTLLLTGVIEKQLGKFVARNDKGIAVSHGKTFGMVKKNLFSWAFKALKSKQLEIKYSKTGKHWEYKIFKKGL